MNNEEVRTRNEESAERKSPLVPQPEYGADSQLHNYNVALTRLGDLFGDDDEAPPPKPPQ